jgi:hypothetical protein
MSSYNKQIEIVKKMKQDSAAPLGIGETATGTGRGAFGRVGFTNMDYTEFYKRYLTWDDEGADKYKKEVLEGFKKQEEALSATNPENVKDSLRKSFGVIKAMT